MPSSQNYFDSDQFRALYPFRSNFHQLNNLQYHYLDEGTGDPVIMVHGNPTWSFYYRELVKALCLNYRVIVPDHMGCGLSDKPSDQIYDYTLERRINDLENLLTTLKIDNNITLVLHDWGGIIGMSYADRYPERIKRIVLFNTAAFTQPKEKSFPWSLRLARNTKLGEFLILRFNAFCRGAAFIGCKRKPMSSELREAYCAPYNSPENRIAPLKFVQDIPLDFHDRSYQQLTSVQSRLKRFQHIPILICWGGRDFVFDNHFLKEWKNHWPQSEVHYFPDCGHYVLEDASEEIIPLVKTFLNSHSLDEAV